MPGRSRLNHDFEIYVDHSCLNTPTSEEHTRDPTAIDAQEAEKGAKMTSVGNQKPDIRSSIETDHHDEMDNGYLGSRDNDVHDEDLGDGSILSDDLDHSEFANPHTHADDGGDSSSHHEATDEDVFSDKSPRSSLGSYEGVPEHGKKHREQVDNMTTATRSPRISDISQYEREYEKEEFFPTARGTPRPPFRTPSDVRAMQMSSPPPPSVLGSPRSTKRQFPTVSRLGTPAASAQYSPKRMSTPSRFKGRKEAPLVLLHVTLLPLRWVWGDLLDSLEADEMSEQVKALRESWRMLQDRIGDTVIERGVLLGHPQNDYEVLEERLLEALELPLRRRARILECGHYLGPANESTLTEDEESEDEWGSEQRSRTGDKRRWCSTCKSEIRRDSLGPGKVFRIKVYASNGLMRAGAWAACWKEMERVDVELEPIVEPALQEELVRLAAAHQEQGESAKEAAQRTEEQFQKKAGTAGSRFGAASPRPEHIRVETPISAEERLRRDEERLREIYGNSSPSPPPPHAQSREPSAQPDQDSYTPPPPSPPRPSEEPHRKEQSRRGAYHNASLPELVTQSLRVLMQDRKNIAIFTLSIFVLMLAFRSAPAPSEPPYEPVIHRMRDNPILRRAQVIDTSQAPTGSLVAASICGQSLATPQQHTPVAEPVAATQIYAEQPAPADEHVQSTSGDHRQYEEPEIVSISASEDASNVASPEHTAEPEPAGETGSQETTEAAPEQDEAPSDYATEAYQGGDTYEARSAVAAPSSEEPPEATNESPAAGENGAKTASVCTVYQPCGTFAASLNRLSAVTLQSEETETETITEKKVVRVFHTVTETEMETATETVKASATDVLEQATPSAAREGCLTEEDPAPAAAPKEEREEEEEQVAS